MSATAPPSAPARVGGIEVRSIDYVPLDERHGKIWSLGPLWFMSNAQIATLAVGTFSVLGGGNLLWSMLAILAGAVVGTFFMAAHSAQGPQLGLPQMIQSRPQFGYVGALLVWAFAYLQYAGFNIFNTILAADALHATVHGSTKLWLVVTTALAALVAIVGYDLIHRVEHYLAAATVAVFAVLTIALFTLDYPAGAFDLGGFKATPFLIQFGAVAGYQVSWAIYVSDYSRYLPPDVGVGSTFLWTYFGSALGGIWPMCLGAAVAAWAGDKFDVIPSLNSAGDSLISGFGAVLLLVAMLGLVSVTALNMYGGSLTLISAADSIRRVRPTLSTRVVMIVITAVLSLVPALFTGASFLDNFESFLLLILYLFIPWTAVNLVDYYVVRHGHYAIAEIFNPRGMYGRWSWRGIVAYLAGFLAMVPFFSTSKFTGFIAHRLDGADISLFIGLPVSAVLYWLFARSLDVESETRIAKDEARMLEEAAHSHTQPSFGPG